MKSALKNGWLKRKWIKLEKREHDVNTFEERHARLGKELNHITRSPEDKKEARGARESEGRLIMERAESGAEAERRKEGKSERH